MSNTYGRRIDTLRVPFGDPEESPEEAQGRAKSQPEIVTPGVHYARELNAVREAILRIENCRVLLDECDDIIAQAQGFADPLTWVGRIEAVEHALARAVALMAEDGGLVAVDS